MTRHTHSSPVLALLAGAMTGAFIWAGAAPALAEDMSAQQILEGLKKPVTRSMGAQPQQGLSASDLATVKRLSRTRSLSSGDRAQMADIASQRPKIDLNIHFDFDSAAVSPRAEPQLNNLGQALSSPEMNGAIIMLGGHTDAKGSDAYNQSLSERRANAIKDYLVSRYRIPAENLVAAGYGESRLKNKADPNAAENRRVEIINMAEKEQAAR